MNFPLTVLSEVEPLVVVTSLIVTVGVFISTLVTIEETKPFGWATGISNMSARWLCIPIPVLATILALVYIWLPSQQWLLFLSYVLIIFDLLIIFAFCVTVIPLLNKAKNAWSIEYLLPQFEAAQTTDLTEIKKLAGK